MKDYLVFRLYGPLVSWGNIAVGEYRPSDSFPTKSAIIGLISASFGFDRSEDGKISELVKSVFLPPKRSIPEIYYEIIIRSKAPETLNGLYLLERTNFWIRSTSRLFFRAEIIEWTPFTT
ncbi:CRISPR-associated protein Cas5 [Leptospira borgpetersenii serovar Pomona str. 200901868]|uniref:CRISPR-associated protein Cas5 n=1 Tax=Leptospira borgpetersenii serovar Pomona str. 200901868 TaxID=1192866 RepID=M6VX89_LEPBO|nr:CRISPR-associated protein Cas5 [Leptospira borgpetersenii serovar Pomona str. 200901868]